MRFLIILFFSATIHCAFGQTPLPDSASNETYIPVDLEDCFRALDKILPDSIRSSFKSDKPILRIENGLAQWIRNEWGLWGESKLAQYFYSIGIFHPDDMSCIILNSYQRRLLGKPLKLKSQIKYYQKYWKKGQELEEKRQKEIVQNAKRSARYLKKHKIPINVLDKLPGAQISFDCDSNIVAKQIFPDGFCFWVVGFSKYSSVEGFVKYKVWERIKPNLGRTVVVSGVNDQGNIGTSTLWPHYFEIRQDSLFEKISLSRLSKDSLSALTDEAKKIVGDTFRVQEINDIIQKNEYTYHRLLFAPGLLSKDQPSLFDKETGDTIVLDGLWELNNRKYYDIHIIKSPQSGYLNYSYRFDDQYFFIDYEGCPEVIELLTAENNQITPEGDE